MFYLFFRFFANIHTMWFVTAQGRGACGDSAVPGAHKGEGQSLLKASRQLRPAQSSQPLPGAPEQGGAAGDLCSLASLRGQRLWRKAHVHTCPASKQVTHTGPQVDTHMHRNFISYIEYTLMVMIIIHFCLFCFLSAFLLFSLQRSISPCWCSWLSISFRCFLPSPEFLALGWRQRASAHTADGDPAHQGKNNIQFVCKMNWIKLTRSGCQSIVI